MKKLILAALLSSFSVTLMADQYVDGYIRKDGTYVPPHYRSSSDSTKLNNWSTQGNFNPHTWQQGTQPAYPDPYQQQYRRR